MRDQKIGIFPFVLLAFLINPALIAREGQDQKPERVPVPPCGVEVIEPGEGERKQERFFPERAERIKELVLDAMLAIGAKIQKDKGNTVEARRYQDRAGHTTGGGERLIVSLEPGEEAGVKGTRVKIETKVSKLLGRLIQKNWSSSILDEVSCILKVLSSTDPMQQLQNLASGSRQEQAGREIILPADMEIHVRLRRYFSSQLVKEGSPIVFEAAEEVVVNGEVVIKKGALCMGKVGPLKGARSYGREAQMEFHVETVMAVDGQSIRLRDESETIGKSTRKQVAGSLVAGGILGGALLKGKHVGVRAGTEFATFVDGNWTIKVRN